jgi:hypothetical protein
MEPSIDILTKTKWRITKKGYDTVLINYILTKTQASK